MASPQRSPGDSGDNKPTPGKKRHLSAAKPPSPTARSGQNPRRAESPRSGVSRSPKPNPTPRGWVVIETLNGTAEQASLILNHEEPRAFSKLARASLPKNFLENMFEKLVGECLDSGGNRDKAGADEQDRVYKVAAIPVRGPSSDDIFAIAFWSAGALEPIPKTPVVGTVEWTPSGMLSTNPAAEYLLRPPNELPDGRTIPELLASFDRWEPRAEFLDMFNIHETPADHWVGTATKRYEDGTTHQFHITARAVVTGDQRRVRAVVCDVSATNTSRDTDMTVAALRAVPIQPGHALALVDLKSAFVHEWLPAEEHSPLAGWRHHHPLYDSDGRTQVALTCRDLALGVSDRARITVRVRFTPTDDWIEVTGTWTRIPSDGRPQAILDITTNPSPPPPIRGCGLCYDINHP